MEGSRLPLQDHQNASRQSQIDNGNEDNQIITLNVGGVIYTTSKSTLTRYPDSMLGAMFSGKHTQIRDDKGHYFIDRDGELFGIILNFLRDNELVLSITDAQPSALLSKRLEKEVRFYQIQPLISELERLTVRSSDIWSGKVIVVEVEELMKNGSLRCKLKVPGERSLFFVDHGLSTNHTYHKLEMLANQFRDTKYRSEIGLELSKLGGRIVTVCSAHVPADDGAGARSYIHVLEKWEVKL